MENGVYFEGAKLVNSYRTICFNNKKVKFVHYFNENSPLTIEFLFDDSGRVEQGKMEAKYIENGYFQISLPNKFNALGLSNTDTMEIGKFFEKRIFINFAIFSVVANKPIIDLSIYIEDDSYEAKK